ncbi:hypothetical protein H2203_005129 [Taxawa tesnikishii (nom. ined.)]|nr:hypothetical protein H2203_005129 [Dothideales sp. JES 119]
MSPTFTRIPDEYFNITYGGGEALTGIFGYERVTLANITVNRQQIAVVQNASWFGNGISSGILGLAFPSLTSAFEGNNPAVDTTSDASDGVEYSPILTTIFTQGEAAPLFTLVLERGNVTSTLAIGGLPPGLPTYKPDNFASAQIQILQVTSEPLTATQYSFYTIYPDGFVFKGANETTYSSGTWSNPLKGPPKGWKPMDKSIDTITTDFPMIIDSGTSLMYLPRNLTYTLLALYDPPATRIPL